MTETDTEYFRRRAGEERAWAERAAHPQARLAHIELADRYDEAASAIGNRPIRRLATSPSRGLS